MTFREKLLITFKRRKVVRLIITQKDRRVFEKIVIPKSMGFCELGEKTYRIDQGNMRYGEKNIPTYLFYEEEASSVPIDPSEWKDKASSPEAMKTALNQKIAKDIIEATSGTDSTKIITIFISVLTLVAVAGAGYFVYEQLQIIMAQLAELTPEAGNDLPPWQQ